MLFTLSYILSRYFCKSAPNIPHYFLKNQSTLLIIGSFIYFLLITINILKPFYRFIYLFVPIDLYCLHKEITKDEFNYNRNIDGNNTDINNGYNSTDDVSESGGIKDKLEKLAELVYEYFARKREISTNDKHLYNKKKYKNKKKKNTKGYTNDTNKHDIDVSNNINGEIDLDINTKIKENYKPDIIKLRDMMTHTIDNIHDN